MAASARTATQVPASFLGRWFRPFVFYVLPILIALVVVLAISLSAYSVLPRLRVSPGYSLVDQNGQAVTSEDMRGGVVLYSFASTECVDDCRASLGMLDAVQDRLESSGLLDAADDEIGVSFVTIFTDANRDTPEQVRAFAEGQQLGSVVDWSLLTGEAPNLNAVVRGGFGLGAASSADEDGFVPGFFLVDEAGFIRAEYVGEIPEGREVADDIASVVDEARAGGFGAAAYGASHKFNFTCNVR